MSTKRDNLTIFQKTLQLKAQGSIRNKEIYDLLSPSQKINPAFHQTLTYLNWSPNHYPLHKNYDKSLKSQNPNLNKMENSVSSSPHQNLHFVLVPWLAQGHIIPMIDIARLLAHRGITVSLITTPANLTRIKPTRDRIHESKLPIHFIPLLFPSTEFGLPDGCENLDSLPSISLVLNFYNASKTLKQQLMDYLRDPKTPSPSCIISDFGHAWTVDIAREFSVPRFVFPGYNCFASLCIKNLTIYKTHESMSSDMESFVLPGLPQQIEITRVQLPRQFQASPQYKEIQKEIRESENFSDDSKCHIIRGWAPQAMILSHVAVGGFLTHCGWNSTLEGICAGLPLLTWPMFAEQFLNEKLVLEVLKIGVSVGVKTPTEWAGEVKDDVVVSREEIAKAVDRVMDEAEEAGERRRRRAEELAEMAKGAMQEGGSSNVNLTGLIQHALDYQSAKNVM